MRNGDLSPSSRMRAREKPRFNGLGFLSDANVKVFDYCYLSIISSESIPVTIWVLFIEWSCLISINNPILKDQEAAAFGKQSS